MRLSLDDGMIVRRVETDADLEAVQRLRYEVFVTEMGGDGPLVDHARGLERDAFDPHCGHLMLIEDDRVIGTFRFMDRAGADRAGGFYSAGEYDLGPLLASDAQVIECGRSCLAADRRGGAAMHLLWQGLAAEVVAMGADILFGVASFPGRDPAPHLAAISHLHHAHLAPPPLRPRALHPVFSTADLMDPKAIDRLAVMRAMPALIKAYLRLGGVLGEGAFVDHAFNTTDVCMVLPLDRVPDAQRKRLLG